MANAALYFVDRHVHEGRGDKVAFREYPNGRALSYGMLAATSDKIAGTTNSNDAACATRMSDWLARCR